MPLPILGGLIGTGIRTLAGAGIIRGSVGKLFGGATQKLLPSGLPRIGSGIIKTIPAIAGGGAIARIGGKSITRKAAELIAAGIAFEAGGRIFNSITGKEIKSSRRMNPGNTRALKRSVRRINAAAKMYGKVLSATKGKRYSGYTIKPKGSKARC